MWVADMDFWSSEPILDMLHFNKSADNFFLEKAKVAWVIERCSYLELEKEAKSMFA
jgi:bifunctional pyridoxal-dependent enzyme with beta-cystathionase and maltose regulon repressor activities